MSNNTPETPAVDIFPVSVEDEMKRSYLDYAMSVIVSRALPDVRDGLKPVHRRILYSMKESGFEYNKPYRKSARIVGDVMGKYHPHGDSAIYDAMVRMAQDFAMRLPLIDGQGNYGSMDGDKPAAMRYTEARLAKSAHSLLDDIDRDTVDFQNNYDETAREPVVLPARFPNLLVNGSGGIAVGMATNIPPHNLGEIIDACCALIDDPLMETERLLDLVPGPDFPTGGQVLGRAGIRAAQLTGRGSVVMRGKTHIEALGKDRESIVITEVPYQVNKANMIEKMADLVREKKIEGISDIRDESDRQGVRVVIELRRDAVSDVVLNQLFRFTPLQTSFGVNMLALNQGRPELLPLRAMLEAFIRFREEVIRRRTIYELGKARDRAHVLVGLAVAVASLDEVIELIKTSPDPQTARQRLMDRRWPAAEVEPFIALIDEPGRGIVDGHYTLSETQARAILDLRLHRLTGLEREKIQEELTELGKLIENYLQILRDRVRLYQIMREELVEMREAFATPRRTELLEAEFEHDIEDLIQHEDMVVTVTNTGYIKRVPLTSYRAQRRGGKGRSGMAVRDEDFITTLFVADTHAPLLFFTSDGMVYKLKVYRLPLGTPQARGKAIVNMIPINSEARVTAIMPLPEDEERWGDLDVMFSTESGGVRRNRLSDFTNVMANGKIAMKLDEGDQLIGVRVCTENDDVLLASRDGKCIRFAVPDVRVFAGRTSTGVRGIKLSEGDKVISMSILTHVDADAEERTTYLKKANELRRLENGDPESDGANAVFGDEDTEDDDPYSHYVELSGERIQELADQEQLLLTITENGFGKRTSAYEYRVSGRGGKGIANIARSERNGAVVASFPIASGEQIMLITNSGKLIRMPVHDVRIAGRATQGVTLFKVDPGETVVSWALLPEADEEETEDGSEVSADGEAKAEDQGDQVSEADGTAGSNGTDPDPGEGD